MKKLAIIGSLLLCCILISKITFSQNTHHILDSEYGLDPNLYSGFVYDGKYELNAKGHPFKYEEFQLGNIYQENTKYENLWLNIDIYQQLLILKFQLKSGADLFLELPLYKFTSFNISSDEYILLKDDENQISIYQSIGNKPYQFLIKHQKNLKEKESYGVVTYRYSAPSKQVFLLNNNKEWISLKKSKDILQILAATDQATVKKWMRKNKFKIRKTSELQLNVFSKYLNQL